MADFHAVHEPGKLDSVEMVEAGKSRRQGTTANVGLALVYENKKGT
jgi:hypothetical protein